MSFGLQGEMDRVTQMIFLKSTSISFDRERLSTPIDAVHTFLITAYEGGGDTLTSATCLLHLHPASLITILCANIATLWLLWSLFIYKKWGGGALI